MLLTNKKISVIFITQTREIPFWKVNREMLDNTNKWGELWDFLIGFVTSTALCLPQRARKTKRN